MCHKQEVPHTVEPFLYATQNTGKMSNLWVCVWRNLNFACLTASYKTSDLMGKKILHLLFIIEKLKWNFMENQCWEEIPSNLSHMGKVQHLGTSLPFVLCSKKKWGTACLVWLKARTLYWCLQRSQFFKVIKQILLLWNETNTLLIHVWSSLTEPESAFPPTFPPKN